MLGDLSSLNHLVHLLYVTLCIAYLCLSFWVPKTQKNKKEGESDGTAQRIAAVSFCNLVEAAPVYAAVAVAYFCLVFVHAFATSAWTHSVVDFGLITCVCIACHGLSSSFFAEVQEARNSSREMQEEEMFASERSPTTGTFAFACPVQSKADLMKAREAMEKHDEPYDIDSRSFQYEPGRPFLENVKLVRYDGKPWLVVETPGKDIRLHPDRNNPGVLDEAQLTGTYLSMYYGEMDWRGLNCFKAGPKEFPLAKIISMGMPTEVAAIWASSPMFLHEPQNLGPNPLPRALVDGIDSAQTARGEVIARSNGRDWSPLEVCLAALAQK